jgi:hypothetical protein
MKKEKKWPLLAAALVMMALTWADNDFSALKELQSRDLAPVIIITAVLFLLKTGALAAVLAVLRKHWNRLKKSKY